MASRYSLSPYRYSGASLRRLDRDRLKFSRRGRAILSFWTRQRRTDIRPQLSGTEHHARTFHLSDSTVQNALLLPYLPIPIEYLMPRIETPTCCAQGVHNRGDKDKQTPSHRGFHLLS